MAENELEGPVLGVSWDGTGYGLDGTIWGGEFLRATRASFERVAHLRTFPLPGGESAIKEPRRIALGLLYEMWGESIFTRDDCTPPLQAFSKAELRLLQNMLRQNLNSPRTSSAGRLFDAVAAIVGLRQQTKFEGQAAMELEFAVEGAATNACYQFQLLDEEMLNDLLARNNGRATIRNQQSSIIIDWAPMIRQLLDDQQRHVAVEIIAAKFHNTLVEMIVAVAPRVAEKRVVLSGGCFQNKYLTERAIRRLRETGFRPYWHQRIPPNDGGIALGQAVAGGLMIENG
jgi:hydrogenase maturation protein HypF